MDDEERERRLQEDLAFAARLQAEDWSVLSPHQNHNFQGLTSTRHRIPLIYLFRYIRYIKFSKHHAT
jgi:hypothetical protein